MHTNTHTSISNCNLLLPEDHLGRCLCYENMFWLFLSSEFCVSVSLYLLIFNKGSQSAGFPWEIMRNAGSLAPNRAPVSQEHWVLPSPAFNEPPE